MRTPRIAPLAVAALSALALCLLLPAGAGAQEGVPCLASPQPEQEPNGTPATATPLALGTFGDSVMARSPGSIGVPGDVDYFVIDAPSGSRLSVLVDTGVLAQLPGATTR